jgi:RnfABCDGE-type electron transport complex B subunit
MDQVTTAAAIMSGLGLFFGTILAVSSRYLRVKEDPRIDEAEEMLPGSNCGACGQAGCRAFAEALVKGEVTPGKCTVSGAETVEAIANLLGVDASMEEKRVARLHCAGGRSAVRRLAEYRGMTTCRGAFVVNGGGGACAWGCLWLGDCERACGFDAIHLNAEGLPVVDVDKCTACGDCVDVCPLDLFSIQQLSHRVILQCSSPLSGDEARAICAVACDACGRCALDAPEGAIEMSGNLPDIKDHDRAPESCTFRCPTGAIRWVDGEQFKQMTVEPSPRRHYGKVA